MRYYKYIIARIVGQCPIQSELASLPRLTVVFSAAFTLYFVNSKKIWNSFLTKATKNYTIRIQQNLERKIFVDNESILAKARKEKYRGKEYENKESTRSNLLATAIALLVGSALFLLEYFIKGTANVGLLAVGLTTASVDLLYEGLKLKKPWFTFAGIVQALAAVVFILFFVGQVVAA